MARVTPSKTNDNVHKLVAEKLKDMEQVKQKNTKQLDTLSYLNELQYHLKNHETSLHDLFQNIQFLSEQVAQILSRSQPAKLEMKTFFTPFKSHSSTAVVDDKEKINWLNRTVRELRKIATRLPPFKADIDLEIEKLKKLINGLNNNGFNKTENIAIKQALMQQLQDYCKAKHLLQLIEAKIASDPHLVQAQWDALKDKRIQAMSMHTQQDASDLGQAQKEAKKYTYRSPTHR